MRLWRSLQSSLRGLLKRSATEQELNDELQDYLEHETKRLTKRGLSYDAARREALCGIGGLEQVKEQCRDARRLHQVDSLLQDSRYALRVLRRSPAFTLAVVLTLAVGIGANTAIFSLMDAVLWQTLPVKNPKQLVLFGTADGNFGGNFAQLGAWGAYSFPLYQQFRKENAYFDDLCAFQSYTSRLNVRVGGAPARVGLGKVVTGNYFSVLGLTSYRGRLLNPLDDHDSRDVTVISYRVWMRLFSGDPGWIGRSIDINGRSVEIVGVTAPEFFGETVEPEPPDFWLPLHLQPIVMLQSSYLDNAEMHWLNVMGRLKRGADLHAALRAQLTWSTCRLDEGRKARY